MNISLSPSGASRWMKCTASPGLIARESKRIIREEFDYTAEGTEAHNMAYRWLLGTAPDMKHKWFSALLTYVDHVRSLPGTLFTEFSMPLFYWSAKNGIADAINIDHENQAVYVTDLKFGEGVMVEAEGNFQMAIYARSVLKALDDDELFTWNDNTKVVMTIVQPRARSGATKKTWETTAGKLHEFCRAIADTVLKIQADPHSPELQYHVDPSDTCQFCPARVLCPSYAAVMLGDVPKEVAEAAGLPVEFPKGEALKPETLVKLLRYRTDITKWLEDLNTYARTIHETQPLPGMKLVDGNGSRSWTDEAEAKKLLRRQIPLEELEEVKLISPAQAEKLLKGKELSARFTNRLASLIKKSDGKPLLVPVSDPREEIKPTDDLEDLDILN